MYAPSGDHVGNPYIPSDVSSRMAIPPSGSRTDSELSAARTAMRPSTATGVVVPAEPLADGLVAGLVELPLVGEGEGVGLPHAVTIKRTIAVAAPPVHLIGQRYARDVPVDPPPAVGP
jgi:hypothetical protein